MPKGTKLPAATDELPRSVGSFFLDSGAHSLYNKYVREPEDRTYSYFRSKKFDRYCKRYARFIERYGHGIHFYATIDAIFNPELTWELQRRLEQDYGLNPVPVIHYGTPLKWVHKYLEAGYKYIGIGGLGQEITITQYYDWADRVFEIICPDPSNLPCVRTHGFAMTSYDLLLRYPWFSVDSASWAKAAAFGSIFIPHKRNGKFIFDIKPFVIATSEGATASAKQGKHLDTLSKTEQGIVREWLTIIGMTWDDVRTNYRRRAVANLRFFEAFRDSLPKYPWPFVCKPVKGFLF